MFLRFRVILPIIFILSLWIGTTPTNAQYDCEGLSVQDCRLWTLSQRTTNQIETSVFALDMILTAQSPETGDRGSVTILTDGAYTLNENRNAQDILTLLQSLSADVSILLSTDDFGEDDTLGIDLNIIDGIGMINLSKFMLEEELETDWYGVDVGAIWQLLENAGGLETDELFQTDDLFQVGFGQGGFIPTTTERLADTSLDGQEMAVLRTTYNYDVAMDNGFNRFLLESLTYAFWEGALAGQGYSESDLDQITSETLALLPYFSLEIERTIGLDDEYIHSIDVELSFIPDVEALETVLGYLDASFAFLGWNARINLFFEMTLTRSQINVPFEITAPTDATIIPFFELLPLLDDVQL